MHILTGFGEDPFIFFRFSYLSWHSAQVFPKTPSETKFHSFCFFSTASSSTASCNAVQPPSLTSNELGGFGGFGGFGGLLLFLVFEILDLVDMLRLAKSLQMSGRSSSNSENSENSDSENEEKVDEKREIEIEISQFEKDFPDSPFKIIDKIGQGTFSSVYVARDSDHYKYRATWCLDHIENHNLNMNLNQPANATCGKVALKRIYATSSATRIATEIDLLLKLRDYDYVTSLVTALRHEDQIIAVLPYFEHDNFKRFFRKMDRPQLAQYMYCLLSALKVVHSLKYIHRDVKPSNFLYNFSRQTGVLIDFGLAQRTPNENDCRQEMRRIAKAPPVKSKTPRGYLQQDSRPSIRASRAGTRGFRAPEVLFKFTMQTSAIDIWSVGVTLLCILTGQFPFFQSNDDVDAILEIAHIFGQTKITQIAASLNRTFDCNLPSIRKGMSFKSIIEKMNPGMVDKAGQECIDLLEQLLEPDWTKRITAADALESAFIVENSRASKKRLID